MLHVSSELVIQRGSRDNYLDFIKLAMEVSNVHFRLLNRLLMSITNAHHQFLLRSRRYHP
jgi:hypothetical protein